MYKDADSKKKRSALRAPKSKPSQKSAKAKNKNKGKAEATTASVEQSVLKALSHNEAEDGLYFRNFSHLHEEDKRPSVRASPKVLISALNKLLRAGKIELDFDELEITFRLTK